MSTFSGQITYQILPNNCLNGWFTNDHPDTNAEIFNEIARKTSGGEGITGTYICSYIDVGNTIHNCTLEISEQGDLLLFSWFKGRNQIFRGSCSSSLSNNLELVVEYTDI